MNRRPSQQVLSIPELLHLIFLHATTHDNFSNLRVCKQWSNEVLNVEWHEVDGARLFRLLAPLERRSTDHLYYFTHRPQPQDWERLERYAWRVKRLTLYDEGYAPSVFLEIASGRSRLALLPNLHELIIFTNPAIFQLFANSTVKVLELHPASENSDLLDGLDTLSRVPIRTPALQRLFVNVHKPDMALRKFESITSSALVGLSQLRTLLLPPAWLSPGVTQAISKMEILETLNLTWTDMSDEMPDSAVFSDRLEAGSFPNLTDLALIIPVDRAAACLSGAYRPTALSALDLYCSAAVPVEDYAHIVNVVASSCPKLKSFKLRVDVRHLPWNYSCPPVQFDVLKPILACQDLQVLEFSHQLPLDVDEDDIVTILESLPSLSELSLNPSPTRTSQPTLHISCLSTIALFSTSLKSLELYMGTAHDKISDRDEEVRFEYLKTLTVGYSPLESTSTIPVALVLSSMLPDECVIHHYQPYSIDPNPVTECWKQVQSLLPAFRQSRKIAERQTLRQWGLPTSKPAITTSDK